MLGTLARWLRAVGHDVLYEAHIEDGELVERAAAERRVILTRDRRLVERRLATDYLLIASDDVERQLLQVLDELDLGRRAVRPFGRCLDCNTPLVALTAEAASPRVPPYVARTQRRFRLCTACDRVYWRATHVTRMRARLEDLGIALPGESREARERPLPPAGDGVD